MSTHTDITDPGTLDLEEFRVWRGLTYDALAKLIPFSTARQARRYCLGERWPDPETIERILAITDRAVSLERMHQSRLAWLRARGGGRCNGAV